MKQMRKELVAELFFFFLKNAFYEAKPSGLQRSFNIFQ